VNWLSGNYKWLFDGFAGASVIALVGWLLKTARRSQPQTGTKIGNSRVTGSAVATGSHNLQNVNSHNINVTLPVLASGAPGRERYDEWRELTHEIHEAFIHMGQAFNSSDRWPQGGIIDIDPEGNDYQAGIQRGDRALRSRLFISDTLATEKVLDKYRQIIEYVVSAHTPRDPNQRGCPTRNGFEMKARAFEDELARIARVDIGQSLAVPEKPCPNISCIGANTVSLEDIGDRLVEGSSEHNAIVIRFANDARTGVQNVGGPIKASLRYSDGENEICGVTGCCWLDEYEDFAQFRVDGRHKLIAGMLVDGELVALTAHRIYAHRRTFFDIERHPIQNFQAGILLVRLTNADTGDLLYEKQFNVSVNPLNIKSI